jgi:hypothetical protein
MKANRDEGKIRELARRSEAWQTSEDRQMLGYAIAKGEGKRLLFCSSRMGFKDEVVLIGAPQPYGEVFVMRYDGTQVEQLTDNQWEEGGPAWQPRKPTLSARTNASQ